MRSSTSIMPRSAVFTPARRGRAPRRRARGRRRCTGSRSSAPRRPSRARPTWPRPSRSRPARRSRPSRSACCSSEATTFAISASSSGRIWSSISISTTSVPKRPNAEAISAPEAPAPITASRAGCSFSVHIPSVSSTRPSKLVPGIGSDTEPVARTTFSASTSLPSTATRPLPGQRRRPVDHVDLVLLHQAGDAAGERLHDLVAVRRGALDVELEPLASRSRTRRRHAPRSARPPRAASPWPGCTPRSGSGRRASPPARRPRSSGRPGPPGSRPRSRPGPDPITTISYLSAIAGSLTSGRSRCPQRRWAAVRHLDAREGLDQEPEHRAAEGQRRPSRPGCRAGMLGLHQQQGQITIASASITWKPSTAQ